MRPRLEAPRALKGRPLVRFALVLGSLSLLAFGCHTRPSDDYETDELAVHIEAAAQPGGTTDVNVSLQVAEGVTYPIELSDGDMLIARVGDVEQVLEASDDGELGDRVHYVASLLGNAEGLPVTVRFVRHNHHDARAQLALPGPIVITAPEGDINFWWEDVTSGVDVEWESSARGDEVEISYKANCDTVRTEESEVVSDRGSASLTFPFGDDYKSCNFDMTLKRRNVGTLSGGWQGEAYATTADRVRFEID